MKGKTTISCVGIWVLLFGSALTADVNVPANNAQTAGRNISDFMTPDGRFDLGAVRASGYQGPLDLKGVDVRVDPRSGAPMVSASSQLSPAEDPDDIYWDTSMSMSIPGVNGIVYSMTVYDDKLIVGGSFTVAGAVAANNIAAWDGSNWYPLSSGTNGSVRALTIYNGKLIVGGQFTAAGSDSASCIVSWDGTNWSPLGSGIGPGDYFPSDNFGVFALTVFDGQLIAGGGFRMAGSDSARCVATWNGSSWSPLGSGFEWPVTAFTVYDGDLWCISGGGVYKWNGASWLWIDLEIAGDPYDCFEPYGASNLTVFDSSLVIVIHEVCPGHSGIPPGYRHAITTWNGIAWSSTEWMDGEVSSLIDCDTELMLGGEFGVKAWDGTDWSEFPAMFFNPGFHRVFALAMYQGNLIAGGDYDNPYGNNWGNIGSSNGWNWSPLFSETGISALTVYDGKLIAGGNFTAAGGVPANHIAAWDGSNWSPLGSGLNGRVFALTTYDGKLVAGGDFTTAGGVTALHIAFWDGVNWSPMEEGMIGTGVHALTVYDGKLIAGGLFGMAGGVVAFCIASWDASSWSPLGSGLDGVSALTLYDGKLIAGGSFTTAGGQVADFIASWDGSSWSPLGQSIPWSTHFYGEVTTLAVYSRTLFAALYTQGPEYGCEVLYGWNGSTWGQVLWIPCGMEEGSWVGAQTVYGNKLIVGGWFDWASGVPAANIVSWDGSTWSRLGSGMGGVGYPLVSALTVFDNKLIVGGSFTTAGNKVSAGLAAWTKQYPTDVEEHDGTTLPNAFSLVQNYPNPFNPTTTIEYSVPTRAHVTVEIFNLLGRHVRTLVDETKSAGTYEAAWDGTDATGKSVSTGVYLYRLTSGEFVETKKMLLLR